MTFDEICHSLMENNTKIYEIRDFLYITNISYRFILLKLDPPIDFRLDRPDIWNITIIDPTSSYSINYHDGSDILSNIIRTRLN